MSNWLHYKTSIDNKNQLIKATVVGQAKPDMIIDMYNELVALAQENQYHKILINICAVRLDYSSEEILEQMERLMPMLFSFKVARIISETSYKHSLIEQVSESKLLNIKNFADEDVAIAWLTKKNLYSNKEFAA